MKPNSHAKRVALYGLLLAVSLLFSYLETLLAPLIPIPGVRVGLANAVVMILLLRDDPAGAAGVNLARIALSSLLFGNAFRFLFSLAGGALSLAVLLLLRRWRAPGAAGRSLLGGVAHNLGQWCAAACLLGGRGLFYYLPPLLACGALAGFAVGAAARGVDRILPEKLF